MWWLLIVIFSLVWLLVVLDRRHHDKIHKHHQYIKDTTINGYFVSEKNEWSRFIYESDNVCIRHIQGKPNSLNETWTRDADSTHYTISPERYAEFDVNTGIITIIDMSISSQPSYHTLTRRDPMCSVLVSPPPTLMNVNELYDLVYIPEADHSAFRELLEKKKGCAFINDWNMYETDHDAIEAGIFAMDKKRTCFFYVPNYIIPLYAGKKHEPKQSSLSEFEQLMFAGVSLA
jgi:hypothetical protein